MKPLEALRGTSPAMTLQNTINQAQNKFARPDGTLVMSPADFQGAVADAAKIAVVGQRDVQTLIAYSSCMWRFTATVNGLNTEFTLDANDANRRKLFSYGVDDQTNVIPLGGFPAGYIARYDDTNLTRGGKPPFGAMLVEQMGFLVRVNGYDARDPTALEVLLANCAIGVGTNGSRKLRHLGSPIFWPGQQGLVGAGRDFTGATHGHSNLGMGFGAQYLRRLDEPLVWQPSGGVDDDFVVQVDIEHDIQLVYTTLDLEVSHVDVSLWCVVAGHSAEHLSANG